MLMATLRSGDEHRNRQDARSSIGQSRSSPSPTFYLTLLLHIYTVH
jgi:hypothetical protein